MLELGLLSELFSTFAYLDGCPGVRPHIPQFNLQLSRAMTTAEGAGFKLSYVTDCMHLSII
jgi:hypothetical protein